MATWRPYRSFCGESSSVCIARTSSIGTYPRPIQSEAAARVPKAGELERAVELAAKRAGSRRAASWCFSMRTATAPAQNGDRSCGGAHVAVATEISTIRVVLARVEYEAWFLAAAESLAGRHGMAATSTVSPTDPESINGMRSGWLSDRMPPGRRYRETHPSAEPFTATFSTSMPLVRPRRSTRSGGTLLTLTPGWERLPGVWFVVRRELLTSSASRASDVLEPRRRTVNGCTRDLGSRRRSGVSQIRRGRLGPGLGPVRGLVARRESGAGSSVSRTWGLAWASRCWLSLGLGLYASAGRSRVRRRPTPSPPAGASTAGRATARPATAGPATAAR